jgi:hypothetical protein
MAALIRSLERAQQAAHESPRTTKRYDRTTDEIALDEIERFALAAKSTIPARMCMLHPRATRPWRRLTACLGRGPSFALPNS